MSVRIRLFYEKRGGACFVPHIALVSLFSRAAARAGILLRQTEGFSPHARMSFGPELPAGVVAFSEPVDIWCGIDPETDEQHLAAIWNGQMPDGFNIKRCEMLPDGAGALGKDAQAAIYCVWAENVTLSALTESLNGHYGHDLLISQDAREAIFPQGTQLTDLPPGWVGVSFAVARAAQNGIGGWVRAASDERGAKIIEGWQNLRIARLYLARLRGTEILEL
ncbi:hypothetical protein AGMMS50276_12920 [Synergistales bacterium]|nr:hypothetical protein AGMMS50276_12920 [Synergistales bacterium]